MRDPRRASGPRRLARNVVHDVPPSASVQSSSASLANARNESVRIATDLRIVDGLRSREPGAARRFSERMRCVPRILAALNARMGRPLDAHDLEDLSQQVLLVILRKLDEFQGLASIEGWAYRICYLELANQARRKRRHARERPLDEMGQGPGEPGRNPWRYEELHRALDRLPEQERIVVQMKHFRELTFEVIAGEIGVNLSTVKARYYRGLECLRQVDALHGLEQEQEHGARRTE